MIRIGVFVCSCGTNIGNIVDVDAVAAEATKIPGVVIAEKHSLLCSPAGREYLAGRISENELDRVVIAACSPREHETTFMGVLETSGLNPFMMEMANIREQVAWVSTEGRSATEKAIRLVRGAIARIVRNRPLDRVSLVCNPEIIVVGGGISGMTAALVLADAGRRVTILERKRELGRGREPEELRSSLAQRVTQREEITVLAGTEPGDMVGFFGNFIVRTCEEDCEIRAGAVVLATGCTAGEDGQFIPSKGFEEIAGMLRLPLNDDGFPRREHDSLAPVSTPMDGVYVAGSALGPCTVEESVARAEAAAGTVLSDLVPGRLLQTEPRTSFISPSLCRGCRTCLEVCGYGAISYDDSRRICTVNSVLCRGCGNCAAACPSGAIRSKHFTPDQLAAQVSGVLS